uniref:Orn/DAP/Arg decarboxylase 2 N-terminal domain-containing protein n=1 Tax=Cyprinus carpio TaxID=7962 RepID=A0A8C2DZN0_CYPCA
MSMKGTPDEPRFSVELLEGSAALRDVIDKHIRDQTLALKSAFLVADLGVIVRQQVRWRAEMDQIRPFYAVKSNSSPVVIEILAALGTGFVCSNKVNRKSKICLISSLSLKLDYSSSHSIFVSLLKLFLK